MSQDICQYVPNIRKGKIGIQLYTGYATGQGCGSGSGWIRIHFPSWIRIQKGKFVTKNRKNAMEIANNCRFIKLFKSEFAKIHCFLLLSNFLCFLQLKNTLHDFFPSNLVKLDLDLDPDPHSEKMLDPDPQKMNANPQSCNWLP